MEAEHGDGAHCMLVFGGELLMGCFSIPVIGGQELRSSPAKIVN